jgi:hypothetical protein
MIFDQLVEATKSFSTDEKWEIQLLLNQYIRAESCDDKLLSYENILIQQRHKK